MFWKVKYEKDGKIDVMYYGSATTRDDRRRRNKKMKENGFKILSCYKVKNLV